MLFKSRDIVLKIFKDTKELGRLGRTSQCVLTPIFSGWPKLAYRAGQNSYPHPLAE